MALLGIAYYIKVRTTQVLTLPFLHNLKKQQILQSFVAGQFQPCLLISIVRFLASYYACSVSTKQNNKVHKATEVLFAEHTK